jgi:hypothetical protein
MARAGEEEFVQTHDDRDLFHASPDDLPVIDIHRLCTAGRAAPAAHEMLISRTIVEEVLLTGLSCSG